MSKRESYHRLEEEEEAHSLQSPSQAYFQNQTRPNDERSRSRNLAQLPSSDQSLPKSSIPPNPQLLRPPGPPGPPGGWLASKMSRPREVAFNLVVCTVQLLPQACLTTCFPIIQIITTSFELRDPAILPWVVAAYAISFGTTILLAGRIGDIFGHKSVVILGFAWLAFFSVLGGLSHYASYEVFLVARAMQGLGSALMNPNALALLGRSYPPGSKGKIIAFSAFGLCAPLGAYCGMICSAVLGELFTWSWCFYATAIASATLGLVAALILPSPMKTPKQQLPFRQKLGQMDWLGGITGVCGLVAVQVALISAPTQGWKTQYIFMLLIIGLLLVFFFVVIELRVSSEPLVPFKLLSGKVGFVLAAVACGWATFGVWTYYLWRFLLGILHYSPIEAAFHVLPIVPVAIIASIITAVLMRKLNPAWILFFALVGFTLGPLLLTFDSPQSIYWSFLFASLVVTPFGMDMSFPSATFIMSNSLPMDKQGIAGSLVTTVVNYSISLGLGFASTVEVNVNSHGHDVLAGIRGGWYFGVGLGGLGIIVCIAFILKTTFESRRNQPNEKQGPAQQEEIGTKGPETSVRVATPSHSKPESIPITTGISQPSPRFPNQPHTKSSSQQTSDSHATLVNKPQDRNLRLSLQRTYTDPNRETYRLSTVSDDVEAAAPLRNTYNSNHHSFTPSQHRSHLDQTQHHKKQRITSQSSPREGLNDFNFGFSGNSNTGKRHSQIEPEVLPQHRYVPSHNLGVHKPSYHHSRDFSEDWTDQSIWPRHNPFSFDNIREEEYDVSPIDDEDEDRLRVFGSSPRATQTRNTQNFNLSPHF